jgi:hypothetical protein
MPCDLVCKVWNNNRTVEARGSIPLTSTAGQPPFPASVGEGGSVCFTLCVTRDGGNVSDMDTNQKRPTAEIVADLHQLDDWLAGDRGTWDVVLEAIDRLEEVERENCGCLAFYP